MNISYLQQRARTPLVGFVFGCIFIIVFMLFVMVKLETGKTNIAIILGFGQYSE